MLEAQGHACAVCREPFTRTPQVDHDHETGRVRGLLCDYCNPMIGSARDDPARLRAGAAWLEGLGYPPVVAQMYDAS